MSNTLEIVFENVNHISVTHLVKELLAFAEFIDNIDCTEPSIFDGGVDLSAEKLRELLNEVGDFAIMIRVRGLRLAGEVFEIALIRVVRYGENVDVDISFDSKKSDYSKCFIRNLQNLLMSMRSRYLVKEIYCGIEPASDELLRYFTNEKPGRLMLLD